MLSNTQIEKLLSQEPITDRYPWSTEDDRIVEEFYKGVCEKILHDTNTLSRIEWDHYGSGYASFVDAWLYKTTPDFNVNKPLNLKNEHAGLVVLLSRLSPYFVFMEAEKSWDA